MEPFESNSFIVKVWLEELPEDDDSAVWRGHITHVPSQERRYLQTLDDAVDFIAPYLERLGVKPSAYRRRRLKRPRSKPD